MAKGYDKSMERKSELNSFGKNLAKRAKSKCELCEASSTKLYTFEIPPVQDEPNFDKCILICEECIDKIERIEKLKENDLRFLANSVWSETPIVKALSVYFLRNIQEKYGWADETLENVYLDEETLEHLESINFSKK